MGNNPTLNFEIPAKASTVLHHKPISPQTNQEALGLTDVLAKARVHLSTQPQLALDIAYQSEYLVRNQHEATLLNLLIASCLLRTGKVKEALALAQKNAQVAQDARTQDVKTICSLKEVAACSYYYLGNFMEALRTISEALIIIKSADDAEVSEERFVALNTQGSIYYRLGQFEQALARCIENKDVLNKLMII